MWACFKGLICYVAAMLKSHLFILFIIALLSGCASLREIGEDNSIHLVSRPVSVTTEAVVRTQTFCTDQLQSLWLRRISFPLIKWRMIPELDVNRPMMDGSVMTSWLQRKKICATQGRITLLPDGKKFFDAFYPHLEAAERRVDIKTYIFDNDDVAQSVADQLKLKSREVPCRVLLDVIGSRRAWSVLPPSAEGVAIQPVANMAHYLTSGSLVELRRARHTLLASEHAKFMLLDDVAFFGGMNIGREYQYDWRDIMFEMRGPVVEELSAHFERAWMLSYGDTISRWRYSRPESVAIQGAPNMYLLETTPTSKQIYKAQIRAIKEARHHIYIENPYLWSPSVVYQLCKARERGVDVRVTVPREVNIMLGASANRAIIKRLIENGVRIFIYPGMTHVKAAVFDQWVCAGSANFDYLSLKKNYELNFMTDDPETTQLIERRVLLKGQEMSTELLEAEDGALVDLFSERIFQLL